jgi:hypothetical protein
MSKIVSYIMIFVMPIVVFVFVLETHTQGEIKIIPRKHNAKEYIITYHYMKTSHHPSTKIVYLEDISDIKKYKDIIGSGETDSWIVKDPKFSNKEYEKRILKRAKQLKSNLIIAILIVRTQDRVSPEK